MRVLRSTAFEALFEVAITLESLGSNHTRKRLEAAFGWRSGTGALTHAANVSPRKEARLTEAQEAQVHDLCSHDYRIYHLVKEQ